MLTGKLWSMTNWKRSETPWGRITYARGNLTITKRHFEGAHNSTLWFLNGPDIPESHCLTLSDAKARAAKVQS